MVTGSGGGNWPWATVLLGPSTCPLPTPPLEPGFEETVTAVYHHLLPLTPTCGLGVGREGQPLWEPGLGSLHA